MQLKDPGVLPDLNYISDYRHATFDMSEEDIEAYIQFVKKELSIEKRRTAFLSKTPQQVAGIMLYQIMGEDLPIDIKICSTLDAALAWVYISPEEHNHVENALEVLRQQCARQKG